MDLVIGYPQLKDSILALENVLQIPEAEWIYQIFIFTLNIVFMLLILGKKEDFIIKSIRINKVVEVMLWCVAVIGPISLLTVSEPNIYFVYGKIREFIGQSPYSEYSRVWIATTFSSMSVLALRFFYGEEIKLKASLVLFVILLLDIYLNNKRFIYGFFVIYAAISYLYGKKSFINTSKIYISIALFFIVYVFYSFNYKYQYEVTSSEVYASTRHEFGRDDVMKYVINEKLIEKKQMVEYPGQTYLSIVLAFVPRSIWVEKPYPYAQYLTGKILYGKTGPALAGWNITNSLYDEAVSNFGWAGFVLILILLPAFLKYIDSNKNIIIKISMLMMLVFYTMTNVNWFLPLVYILAFIIFLRFVLENIGKLCVFLKLNESK
ncbi:hypothetical protein PTW35_13160 [Photobacterium sp. DA100]|uniref:hypothetical protein n=1 Tax=Photobacterium sp. DA100 TaxID=3027472 RepID=UPI00247A3148|nr:hypothetical protein [Photobacterium sp. DA100]WEM41558.1 hypothetical protein PTW35_13160 [Photobacterium sp. DA100]